MAKPVQNDGTNKPGSPQAIGAQGSETLKDWLGQEGGFGLALAPAFFGFYGYIGALFALQEEGLLEHVRCISGASAGALVGGMLAAGMPPEDMARTVLGLERTDFWDPPAVGGLLKGARLQALVRAHLPAGARTFEGCPTPCALTGFNLLRLRTELLDRGDMADAIVASCTFPGMFAPVFRQGCLLVDGGVGDPCGLRGQRLAPGRRGTAHRVLNLCLNNAAPWGPADLRHTILHAEDGAVANGSLRLASLCFGGALLPRPGPFAMGETGGRAMQVVYELTKAALARPMSAARQQEHGEGPAGNHKAGESCHWVFQMKPDKAVHLLARFSSYLPGRHPDKRKRSYQHLGNNDTSDGSEKIDDQDEEEGKRIKKKPSNKKQEILKNDNNNTNSGVVIVTNDRLITKSTRSSKKKSTNKIQEASALRAALSS